MSETVLKSSKRILNQSDIINSISPLNAFARDVFLGLTHEPMKYFPSKYLYNDEGSKIYEEIMDLPEYYLLRSEFEILSNYKGNIAETIVENDFNLIELGVGNGLKTNLLLEEFLHKEEINFEFVPVDISQSAIEGLIKSCDEKFPSLQIQAIVSDYFDAINWLSSNTDKRNVVLFLGSNIGNFLYEGAVEFLYRLWAVMNHEDYLIIGFDLRKELELMLPAYNDSKGVTAKFNLNLLTRINDELGANFDISNFKHYEPYNVETGAMTSYLLSMEEQEVFIKKLNQSFHFKKWEPIHIEQSYKYTEEDIDDLATTTGFEVVKKFYDQKHYFCDAIWQAVKKD